MSNEKVTYKQLRSAVVQVDNSADAGRTYAIAADVRVQNPGGVEAFEGGTVAKDGAQVATFSCWGGDGNIGISYSGLDTGQQCQVLEACHAFMQDVRDYVEARLGGGSVLPGGGDEGGEG